MQCHFEWDPVKAVKNINKHSVAFRQASEVFSDAMALTIFDESNSNPEEERWITLGQINSQQYIVVVHTYRNLNGEDISIRIISARQATKNEIKQYEQGK